MRKNAENSAFTNARTVRVCEKMTTERDRKQKKPYLYGILRKTRHGMDFIDPAVANFIKLLMSLGEIMFFNRVFGKSQFNAVSLKIN